MNLIFAATSRGFSRADFIDRYQAACSVQESSLAEEPCIWLGTANDRMHLTQHHVRALLPALQHFLATGRLPSPEAEVQ